MLMLLLLMMVSCSQDSSNDGIDEPQNNLLRLSSVTRSNRAFTPSEGNSIKMYVMTKNAQYSEGNFNYTTSWANSNIRVKEHEQYYMYGFMPAGSYSSSISATATELNGDYSRGADLTIQDLPIFTNEDICAIVGVQRISATSEATNIIEGNFGYLSGLNSENYVNLLMDHLYGELALQFKVDADYYALRHIKLKSVTLNYDNGQGNDAANVNVTVRLRDGYGLGQSSVVYTPTGNKASHTFLADGSTFLNSDATAIGSGVKCPPSLFNQAGTYMTLTCTYDVCSTDDNNPTVIRADCSASNKMRVSGMEHGKTNTVTVTIAPTYLYVLTDPDLDNPTIYIGG
jgi:hypothetical protein